MKALLQRVNKASVEVEGEICGRIGPGWLVLLGVGKGDTDATVGRLIEKMIGLRLFSDHDGKFNLSIEDIGGAVLVVSQFTLYADCSRGRRPGFSDAAPPELSKQLYEKFVIALRAREIKVETGFFGAHMKVVLENDGPVTIMLDTRDFGSGT